MSTHLGICSTPGCNPTARVTLYKGGVCWDCHKKALAAERAAKDAQKFPNYPNIEAPTLANDPFSEDRWRYIG